MEPFVPQNADLGTQFMFWLGSVSFIVLLGVVGFLWRENRKIKDSHQNEIVVTIKNSIDNLSVTITHATNEFKDSMNDMWEHIGELRDNVSWLTGQHEANHQIKYDGKERRKKPRPVPQPPHDLD